jgi:hypothetical protein
LSFGAESAARSVPLNASAVAKEMRHFIEILFCGSVAKLIAENLAAVKVISTKFRSSAKRCQVKV